VPSSLSHPQRLVAIGASAGGIEALLPLFEALGGREDLSFLVVLHIPAHTPTHLDQVLAKATPLRVSQARDGEPIRAGHVYVPPADRHLMVEGERLRLSRGPKECRMRPAVDVLFRSLAISAGPRAIGLVLSGMLDDGTAGLWAIKDRGGVTLVQDPGEAMYPSMPESALRHVEADLIAPVQVLAAELTRLAGLACGKPGKAELRGLELENEIAGGGNALEGGVMKLGKQSQYTCPDCHGVLVQIEEGSHVRFRCHTGHAFSTMTLLAEINESIDNGLWDAIRALEERLLLLRQVAQLARQDNPSHAQQLGHQVRDVERAVKTLRKLVLEPELFGHAAEQ